VSDNERTPADPKTTAKPPREPASEIETTGIEGATAARDAFQPDAIAARIDAIGAETEVDRIAREEEKKLLARKQKARAGMTPLEMAASRRLARIGEVQVKRPTVAAEWVPAGGEPVGVRIARLGRWVRSHQAQVAWITGTVVVCLSGVVGWTYWRDQRDAAASSTLARALAFERGQIASKKDADEDDRPSSDLYPTFATVSDRRAASLAKYREVESRYSGTGAAYIARLAEGGLLLDSGDPRGALAAFNDISTSPLAHADVQVRGRALEGIGFAHEGLAEAAGADHDKEIDLALASYKALAQLNSDELQALGAYHQARLLQGKGERSQAVELLKGVHERVTRPGDEHAYAYLEFVADDRLRELDPTALPPETKPSSAGRRGGAGGLPPGVDPNDPEVQRMLQQLREQSKHGGGPAAPRPGR